MTPTTGKAGDSVSIICKDIGATPTVAFGTVAAPVVSVAAPPGGLTQINVKVPATATTGKVFVYDSKSGKTLDCGTFTVTATPPTPAVPAFVSMTPLTGKVGDAVAITVKNVAVTSTVKFGTISAPVKSTVLGAAGAITLNVNVPANAVTAKVSVTDPTSAKVLDCGTFTVTTTPTPAAPAIVSAVLEDTNGNKVVDKGDKLTVKFNQEVVLSSTDPNGQLALGVAGDTFGTGATMASGTAKTDVVVSLGTAPKVRVTGTYAPTATGTFKASGLNVAATSTIKNATGVVAKPGAAAVDVGSTTFKEGCFTVGIAMQFSRGLHSATLLDDGRLLVVGGVTANGPGTANYQRENEIFDPVTNKFTTISDPLFGSTKPRMERLDKGGKVFAVGRYAHAAVKLADGSGKVLIAGGHGFEDRDVAGQPIYGELTTCFVFDPKTKNFTETGRLTTERRDGVAIAFTSGKVLIMGGRDRNGTLKTTEVWDPATGKWTAGPSLNVDRYDAAIVPFSTGILVAGGASQTGRLTATPTLTNVTQDERYTTTSGTFVTTGSLAAKRRAATGTILANGDVLVAGGTDANGGSISSVERFDAATAKFVAAGNLKAARGRAQARRVENDVLVVGGMAISATGGVVTVDSVETVGVQGSIQSYPLNVPRLSHTVTKLVDGRVLILGGFRTPVSDIRGLDGVSNYTGEVFSRP